MGAGEDILVASGCRIDPGARLIGPVVLHEGAVVAAGATVVGPTVVGSGGRIDSGAVVAQAMLAPDAHVGGAVSIRRRVISGNGSVDSALDAPEVDSAVVTPLGVALDRKVNGNAPKAALVGRRHLQRALKRVLDLVASALMLAVLWPLLLAVAVWVKMDSPGPAFFLHRRERRGGREFACVKFRTMTADAHLQQRELYECNEVDGPQFKLHKDPRVTRVGKWLRRYNIDELPQLLNVLAGQMSLVGPRPSPFRENQICVPWRRARLSVRPGITGLWQICRSGEDGASGFHEWIYFDLAYVRHFSIWLDLKILAATLLSLGGRRHVSLNWFGRELGEGFEAEFEVIEECGIESSLGNPSTAVI
jgi:lipopolysaccharide/colanic/teichoic acid biosynthesis glycosyltransferase